MLASWSRRAYEEPNNRADDCHILRRIQNQSDQVDFHGKADCRFEACCSTLNHQQLGDEAPRRSRTVDFEQFERKWALCGRPPVRAVSVHSEEDRQGRAADRALWMTMIANK